MNLSITYPTWLVGPKWASSTVFLISTSIHTYAGLLATLSRCLMHEFLIFLVKGLETQKKDRTCGKSVHSSGKAAHTFGKKVGTSKKRGMPKVQTLHSQWELPLLTTWVTNRSPSKLEFKGGFYLELGFLPTVPTFVYFLVHHKCTFVLSFANSQKCPLFKTSSIFFHKRAHVCITKNLDLT